MDGSIQAKARRGVRLLLAGTRGGLKAAGDGPGRLNSPSGAGPWQWFIARFAHPGPLPSVLPQEGHLIPPDSQDRKLLRGCPKQEGSGREMKGR